MGASGEEAVNSEGGNTFGSSLFSLFKFFLRNNIKREKECIRRDIEGQSQEKLGK